MIGGPRSSSLSRVPSVAKSTLVGGGARRTPPLDHLYHGSGREERRDLHGFHAFLADDSAPKHDLGEGDNFSKTYETRSRDLLTRKVFST